MLIHHLNKAETSSCKDELFLLSLLSVFPVDLVLLPCHSIRMIFFFFFFLGGGGGGGGSVLLK